MPKLKNKKTPPKSVLIEVPVAEVPPAMWRLHINTHLNPKRSHALRRVTAKLDQRLARLPNGRRFVNPRDALKYVPEQIHAE